VGGVQEKRGGKRDSQGGGKWEKKGKIMQHCAIFCNQKNTKRWEPTNTGWEQGLTGTGSRQFKPPPPPTREEKQVMSFVMSCVIIIVISCGKMLKPEIIHWFTLL